MSEYIDSVPVIILAGGRGGRLGPITNVLPKPAVPFGKHKIIDFMLSNSVNSGFRRILLATQYLAHPLNIHVNENWPSAPLLGFSIYTIHPQQANGIDDWYRGTADAILQNLGIIKNCGNPQHIAVLSGDHVVAIDFKQMYEYHLQTKSSCTICAMEINTKDASRFGVLTVNYAGRIEKFTEKPECPAEIPGRPGRSLVSMGHYFFNLLDLETILNDDTVGHDFGNDIIPKMLDDNIPMFAYNYQDNVIPGQTEHYWQDVGTVESYWNACMDLVSMKPSINLYNKDWPMRTGTDNLPMGKNNYSHGIFALAGGAIVERCDVDGALIGRSSLLYESIIRNTVVFDNVVIHKGCKIQKAIICEGVVIPPDTVIGYNREDDVARGLYFDQKNPESGIVTVPTGYVFE